MTKRNDDESQRFPVERGSLAALTIDVLELFERYRDTLTAEQKRAFWEEMILVYRGLTTENNYQVGACMLRIGQIVGDEFARALRKKENARIEGIERRKREGSKDIYEMRFQLRAWDAAAQPYIDQGIKPTRARQLARIPHTTYYDYKKAVEEDDKKKKNRIPGF